jgi:quercetin dioxygenase-like cupin family protein
MRSATNAPQPHARAKPPENVSEIRRIMTQPSKSSAVQTGNFIAEPLDLESLVTYQKHSVVSKQVLNKKAGTLTLFAFDKGEGLSEHTAPYDASVLVLDGKAEIKIGGKPHVLKKGEMIIMPANVPHALKAVEPFKMLLIMIRSAE